MKTIGILFADRSINFPLGDRVRDMARHGDVEDSGHPVWPTQSDARNSSGRPRNAWTAKPKLPEQVGQATRARNSSSIPRLTQGERPTITDFLITFLRIRHSRRPNGAESVGARHTLGSPRNIEK